MDQKLFAPPPSSRQGKTFCAPPPLLRLNCIFHFYFLNQDFFLTIISITLLFGDLVDHLEGIRNFDLSPSFHFMTKNG